MYTKVCDQLGIEYPIFAFTHCRDVVAAVSRAGGLGVLGAISFTPERLREELDWIDAHVDGRPYGVDFIIPQAHVGKDMDLSQEELEAKLRTMIPQQHWDFVDQLMREHQVPELPAEASLASSVWTAENARPLLDEALKHTGVRLIANALGTPPVDIIDEIHASGRLVAALCGKPKQALRHKEAGVDLIIAQGGEGGGHTGDIGSMVLWPQVVDAVAPTPVLAAGGIGNGRQVAAALAMGAAGVWTGSLWLTVEEAEADPDRRDAHLRAGSDDTVRSRAFTGKPCRLLRNDWTDAWAAADTPEPLGMPLQGILTAKSMVRTSRYPGGEAQKVAFNPAGQVIGMINEVENVRGVMFRLLDEYATAVDHLGSLMPDDSSAA